MDALAYFMSLIPLRVIYSILMMSKLRQGKTEACQRTLSRQWHSQNSGVFFQVISEN